MRRTNRLIHKDVPASPAISNVRVGSGDVRMHLPSNSLRCDLIGRRGTSYIRARRASLASRLPDFVGLSLVGTALGKLVMSTDLDLQLGKRLRRRRRLLGLTQAQLADAAGIRFQQVAKYECGANRISAARLAQFITKLEVPASYFFDNLAPGVVQLTPAVDELQKAR